MEAQTALVMTHPGILWVRDGLRWLELYPQIKPESRTVHIIVVCKPAPVRYLLHAAGFKLEKDVEPVYESDMETSILEQVC